ncbi:DUF6083 domain-containing protein [Streptomyces sp. NPDC008001]|uniref:DUF6083 domain-containing protein n=1 Tax=Streptomyces sp. NPDC008001 TaxID=3364804 RepID=UPI0036E6AF16
MPPTIAARDVSRSQPTARSFPGPHTCAGSCAGGSRLSSGFCGIRPQPGIAPGRYVLLEPRYEPPAHAGPAGHRWITHPDGTATNLGAATLPAGSHCRIPHALVCPCSEEPSGPAVLKALWQHNSGLIPHVDQVGDGRAT